MKIVYVKRIKKNYQQKRNANFFDKTKGNNIFVSKKGLNFYLNIWDKSMTRALYHQVSLLQEKKVNNWRVNYDRRDKYFFRAGPRKLN